jgi:hypothetical protein
MARDIKNVSASSVVALVNEIIVAYAKINQWNTSWRVTPGFLFWQTKYISRDCCRDASGFSRFTLLNT